MAPGAAKDAELMPPPWFPDCASCGARRPTDSRHRSFRVDRAPAICETCAVFESAVRFFLGGRRLRALSGRLTEAHEPMVNPRDGTWPFPPRTPAAFHGWIRSDMPRDTYEMHAARWRE